MINRNQDSGNINYLMVNQDQDDLGDPANSLVDVNPDQEDFGQINRNRLWSVSVAIPGLAGQRMNFRNSRFLLRNEPLCCSDSKTLVRPCPFRNWHTP